MVEVTHKARDVAKSIFAHEEFETACHQLTSFYQSGILEGRRQMREEAAAIAEKWRDENKAAAAAASKSFSAATRDMVDELRGAAIECNAILGAIRAIPIGDE